MGVPDRFWWLQCSLCHPASAPSLFTQCVCRMAGQLSWLLPGMGMLSYCGNWSSNTDVTRMLWKRCTIISIVHVCVCACVRACVRVNECASVRLYVHLCVCVYAYSHLHMDRCPFCLCVYSACVLQYMMCAMHFIHLYIHVWMYTRLHTSLYVHKYMHACICMCPYSSGILSQSRVE